MADLEVPLAHAIRYRDFKLTGPAILDSYELATAGSQWLIDAQYTYEKSGFVNHFLLRVYLAPPHKGAADALRAWAFADRVIPKTGRAIVGNAKYIDEMELPHYGICFRR